MRVLVSFDGTVLWPMLRVKMHNSKTLISEVSSNELYFAPSILKSCL